MEDKLIHWKNESGPEREAMMTPSRCARRTLAFLGKGRARQGILQVLQPCLPWRAVAIDWGRPPLRRLWTLGVEKVSRIFSTFVYFSTAFLRLVVPHNSVGVGVLLTGMWFLSRREIEGGRQICRSACPLDTRGRLAHRVSQPSPFTPGSEFLQSRTDDER